MKKIKSNLSESTVKVWREPLTIPTYKVGAADTSPIFYTGKAYQGAQGHVYPYPLMDTLTEIREDRVYDAAFLENEYVKICVLPEIGGRIFSALDKTNNYDFFYRQHVIKPGLIGMLGAWISGGVEWNVPHHHRATTFMPVDCTLKKNQDGSSTIWIGETELRHRIKWVIGLTLFPDRSYLEATVKIINCTPFSHSFLYWANVAVHANPMYQVIFPPDTEYVTHHGKNQFTSWPISHDVFSGIDFTGGVDISWWKNHPAPNSFFAWNYQDDFFGGYDHGKQAGVIYVADHHYAAGKKFFLFGNNPPGQMWDKILTETDGPYIELMASGYSDNQPDYVWIQPHEIKTLKQYWYPIQKIGGVKNANFEAALNLEVLSRNTARIGFNTTSGHKGAKVLLKAGERIILEQKIDIGPNKPFGREIPLPPDAAEEKLQLSLFSAKDKELITYQPVKTKNSPRPYPVQSPPAPENVKTIEELYLIGLRLEQFHNPILEVRLYYQEALARDPGDYRVNTALGILYCKQGMFKEAEERLNLAIERATQNHTTPKDGEAYYYLGTALKFQKRYDDACNAFFKATWYQTWQSAGYYSLAELYCLKGDFRKALDFVVCALSANAPDTKALSLKAALLRRLEQFEQAEKTAAEVLTINPLDFWATNELCLAKSASGLKHKTDKGLNALNAEMAGNAQSCLELAVNYGNCGLWDEGIEILSRFINSKRGKNVHPMVYYTAGYFCGKQGKSRESSEYYRLGSRASAEYCFPFRLESISVLSSVAENNPEDGRVRYYLGNLFYYLGHHERAIREWEKSRDLDAGFSVVHRNLGFAYSRIHNDIPAAINSLEKAIACDKNNPRFYYELDLLYEAGKAPLRQRLDFLKENQAIVLKRDDAFLREIILYVQLGDYDTAIALLSKRHFFTMEGAEGAVHNTYVDAYLLRGRKNFEDKRYSEALRDYESALDYPDNLGIKKPYLGDRSPQIYYQIGTVYDALGETEKARRFYEKSVSAKHGRLEVCYYKGLAFRKLGQEDKANQMFDELINLGTETIKSGFALDFFAKFGQTKSEQDQRTRIQETHYLLGLGYLGKGKKEEAKTEFKKVLELNANHIGASGVCFSP